MSVLPISTSKRVSITFDNVKIVPITAFKRVGTVFNTMATVLVTAFDRVRNVVKLIGVIFKNVKPVFEAVSGRVETVPINTLHVVFWLMMFIGYCMLINVKVQLY